MIQVRHLSKRYGSVAAVDGLTFDVVPGKVTGFLGPNEAGKSTTMRLILGLDAPTAGTATSGATWSTPIRVDQSPGDVPAFIPQVHVNADGAIGVTYYDLQNATGTQPGLTDAYLATCPAATSDCTNPASWPAGGQTLLSTTGSFDMTDAPSAGGYFVGDYEGLTSTGSTFDPFFVMAKPVATKGPTDPFANTAG